MIVSALCMLCQPWALFPDFPLPHCYGEGDRPCIPGLLGSGFRCRCECRERPATSG